MIKQRTIKRVVKTTGIGLHSGRKVTLILRPSSMNTGIVYRRIDLTPPIDLTANAHSVGDTMLSTCLINKEGIRIATVEHLSAAIGGLGIDNIKIEINSSEVPIMDGSSGPFISLLIKAGMKELNSSKKFIRVKKSIRIEDGEKWVEIKPYNGFSLSITIDFNHPVIKCSTQHYDLNFSVEKFVRNISQSRTFGFIHDIKYLHSCGLCLGASFNCAIVMDNNRILNKNGLRYENEFVRHKMLDAIGDLFICGHNIIGAFTAFKPGHFLNNKLLQALMNKKDAWEWSTLEENETIIPLKWSIKNLVL